MVISILLAIIIAAALVLLIMLARKVKKPQETKDVSEKIQKKGKGTILKEAERKLAHDPHNIAALEAVGDIHFLDKEWEKAWGAYKTLYDLSSVHVDIDVAKTCLRMGIAAFNLGKFDDAINSLMTSMKKNPDVFETNLYLGKAFYEKQVYDKAIACLKKAKILSPENTEINKILGISFFKMQRYKEALPFLKKTLDETPDDKEILFDLAIAMSDTGYADKALKVFMHLRPDPIFGPQSCLEAGKMHEKVKDYQSAIQDYLIAGKLQAVPEQILLQIKYRCASDYIATNDIPKGLTILKQIQTIKSGYKDVDALVARYSELNQNKNLQTYLMSGTSEFIALCRKVISAYHKDDFVKVEDVNVSADHVEIICTIENSKMTNKEIFRFYRTQAAIGDINIREFHSKVRDSKCDMGICVTIGSFSESSHKFIEGRPVNLVEKEELTKILKKINLLN